MSKPKTLSAILSALFPKSEKVISEKLSTQEHETFAADASELQERLDAQTTANELVTADLTKATARVTELEGSLAAAEGQVATLTASLTAMTTERDTYKAHHEKAVQKGDKDADQDHNSRGSSGKASYNENAMNVWQKANA